MITRTNYRQYIMAEYRTMEGILHPSIENGENCCQKSDFDQQQTQSRLINVELNSTLTSVSLVCW